MTIDIPTQTHTTANDDDPYDKQHTDLASFHGIEINSEIKADAQETLCLEDDLHNLRSQRLGEVQQPIYILPMAKTNLQALDDDIFFLKQKVHEFLASEREIMLILGDSGAGKSSFNRHLERLLWNDYMPGGPIPLFVNLPTIDDPAHDLIEKQLQYHNFSEDQILEMKQRRQFILICDGYDESQLTINIHTTNQLNQPRQWRSKVIISCRSQFLEPDYRSRFQPQPVGRHQSNLLNLFQEAVIAPFSKKQIEEYVARYVPLKPRPWVTGNYMHMLITIPNLMDLVKNPFLLTLALEALPSIAEGKENLSTVKVTRVQLYDNFVLHWLDVNKRRLESNAHSVGDRTVFDQLLDAGFITMGLNYCMRLATAIFERQDGRPVVQYTHLQDHDTWKADFFGVDPVVRLLQESCPLTRIGNQFLFLHRSMLEYFFSLNVYNPFKMDDDFATQTETPSTAHAFDPNNTLFRRNLLTEPSIIQFLCDRVKLDSAFNLQLLSVVNLSKTDAAITTITAATNAITTLVRAGVTFHGADLRGVKIPGADLSGGQFDYALFQGAYLSRVNLSRSWLRKADLSGAQMDGVQFGELPYLELDRVVHVCAYSPDGRMLAVGIASRGINVGIYETTSWTRIYSFTAPGVMKTMAFSPDGARIVFGGESLLVWLWDCASGQEMFFLKGHRGIVNSVAFSPCGKHIASSSEDKTVRVWESQTGENLLVLEGHMDVVKSVKYSPSGERLVSGSYDGTIRFWNSETGEPGVILNSYLSMVYSLAISPDGQWLASGHMDGGVQLWHAESGVPGHGLHGHTKTVTGIAFSPDCRWVASSSLDGTIRLWNTSTGAPINRLSSHKTHVHDVVFSPNGLQIASGGGDSNVRLWDVDSILTSSGEQQDQIGAVWRTVYSPDGQYILTVSNNQTFKQWSSLTGASSPLSIELPKSLSVWSVSYSLKGIPTVAASQDESIKLWELQERGRETILKESKAVHCVAMSPCCRWIMSVDWDNTVTLWDLDSTQKMHVLIENGIVSDEISWVLAFSPTGHRLAISVWNGTIRLFDIHSKSLITAKMLPDLWITAMSFSPDGQQLALGTDDGLIYLWGLQSEECAIKLRGHTEKVQCLAYSPCGEWVASGSQDKTVRLWRRRRLPGDTESWSCVSTVHGYFDIVNDIDWSPTVPLEFVTSCRDESVRVWRVSSDGKDVVVKLLWGTNLAVLHADGVMLKGTTGLGSMDQKMLVQRGAIDGSLALEEDGRSDVEDREKAHDEE